MQFCSPWGKRLRFSFRKTVRWLFLTTPFVDYTRRRHILVAFFLLEWRDLEVADVAAFAAALENASVDRRASSRVEYCVVSLRRIQGMGKIKYSIIRSSYVFIIVLLTKCHWVSIIYNYTADLHIRIFTNIYRKTELHRKYFILIINSFKSRAFYANLKSQVSHKRVKIHLDIILRSIYNIMKLYYNI